MRLQILRVATSALLLGGAQLLMFWTSGRGWIVHISRKNFLVRAIAYRAIVSQGALCPYCEKPAALQTDPSRADNRFEILEHPCP